MIQTIIATSGYLVLLIVGAALLVFGLLQATHPPFQHWWHSTRWYDPDKKRSADVNTSEYMNDIAHMKIAGMRGFVAGFLMILFALVQLGLF